MDECARNDFKNLAKSISRKYDAWNHFAEWVDEVLVEEVMER